MYKHCFKLDSNGTIIKAYSTGIEDYVEGDIVFEVNEERQFPFEIADIRGLYLYRWDKKKGLTPIDNAAAAAKKAIFDQLTQLDSVVSRSVEDLYLAVNATPVGNTKIAIDKKAELRKQLKGL
jgi:hypothetical protein